MNTTRMRQWASAGLWVVAALCADIGMGQNNRDELTGTERLRMSRAAALANPVLMKRIQDSATRYLTEIQSELVAYSKQHPVLSGIEKETLHAGSEAGEVRQELFFSKNTTLRVAPSGVVMIPADDGLIMRVGIRDSYGKFSATGFYKLLMGGMELFVCYNVDVGKNYKDIEGEIGHIIDKRLRSFCDEMNKLKTKKGD